MKFPTTVNLTGADGKTDYTLLSKDCFHMTQKGHRKFLLRLLRWKVNDIRFLIHTELFALNLWNAMLTPETERSERTELYGIRWKCPTLQNPYLRTWRN